MESSALLRNFADPPVELDVSKALLWYLTESDMTGVTASTPIIRSLLQKRNSFAKHLVSLSSLSLSHVLMLIFFFSSFE